MQVSKPVLIQGTLNLLILSVLRGGKMHGFEIQDRIAQGSGKLLLIEEGSLYPALHRLEKSGFIKGHWGASEKKRRAKFYELTAAGRRELALEMSAWKRNSDAVTGVLDFSTP